LWQGIRQTYPTQTIIASTHRPVILAQADLVVVVDNGRIVACGPFAQLRQQHALLQQLWQD
jgi:ATP-binding cassette subfamily B protein